MNGEATRTHAAGHRGLSFGEEVLLLRRKKKLRGVDAAGAVGYTSGTLYKVEAGQFEPSSDTAYGLIDLLADDDADGDRLAVLAAEASGQVHFDARALDPLAVEVVAMLRRRIAKLSREDLEAVRSVLTAVA